MRLVFLGTPEVAVASLDALVAAGHDLALVVTGPDRRRGRGSATSPSPVGARAHELGIPVSHDVRDAAQVGADLGIVVAFGRIVPSDVLAHLAMINVHFSRLPRWRGAAPLERAILAGDESTAVSIMGLEATLDTGPVYATRDVVVQGRVLSEVRRDAAARGAALLVEVLADPEGLSRPEPQRGEATYAEKITAQDLTLSPAESVEMSVRRVRLERAFAVVDGVRVGVLVAEGRPGASVGAGEIAVVDGELHFGVRDGALNVTSLRPAGRSTMEGLAWWRGRPRDAGPARWSSAAVDEVPDAKS